MNYYEHHLGDYAEATGHLSFVEDAAYSRLMRKAYATEKPLPADTKAVQRLIGARTKEERQAVEDVLLEFWVLGADGWHNERCDAEIARFQDKQRKAKASADARWSQTERNANASPNAMRTHSEGNAPRARSSPQTPDTSHQEEKPPAARFPPWAPPAWMPEPQWEAFIAMRKAKGKRAPFTDAARDGIVAALAKLRASGHDVAMVLQESVNNGWSGVFTPKVTPIGKQLPGELNDMFRRGAA